MVACYGSSAWRWCRDTERPRFEGSCHGRGSDAVSAGFANSGGGLGRSHDAASASYSWLRDARRYCAMVLRDCVRIQPRRYGPGCHDTEGDACVLWTPDGAAGISCWVTDLPLVSYPCPFTGAIRTSDLPEFYFPTVPPCTFSLVCSSRTCLYLVVVVRQGIRLLRWMPCCILATPVYLLQSAGLSWLVQLGLL